VRIQDHKNNIAECLRKANEPLDILDVMGCILRKCRDRRPPDYREVRSFLLNSHPSRKVKVHRAGFGLPLNFSFRKPRKLKATVYAKHGSERTRWASPLILKVHPKYGGLFVYLKRPTPKSAVILQTLPKERKIASVDPNGWRIVRDFLKSLPTGGKIWP